MTLATALATVPAAFTFFPEAGSLADWIRALVAAVWVALLVSVAWLASGRDAFVDTATRRYAAKQADGVRIAAARVFPAILDPAAVSLADHYQLSVYILDQDTGELVPVYPDPGRGPDDVRVFAPDVGAVGRAYDIDGIVYARGSGVTDASFGLSTAQIAFYDPYRSVAALAIRDGDQVIGVLSAISAIDDGAFSDSRVVEGFRDLADSLATLLDLFGLVE